MTRQSSKSRPLQWLRESIWPIPFAIILASILIELALIFYYKNTSIATLTNVASAGSSLLSVIASTVFSSIMILFSITMMVLALSANQYGSRLLHYFLRDTFNQVVIGYLGGLYIFAMTTILYGNALPTSVHQILVVVAISLAIGAIFLFIFFVRNVTQSIQAPNIIRRIGGDYRKALDQHAELGSHPTESKSDHGLAEAQLTVRADKTGYFQTFKERSLVELAHDLGVVIELMSRPGDYIVKDAPVARIYGERNLNPDKLAENINALLTIDKSSAVFSDLEYSVRQIITIALRALSPSLTDHFNCTNCIDELTSAVFVASQRSFPSGLHYDEAGALRLQVNAFSFQSLVGLSFDQIRQNSANVPASLYVSLYLTEKLMNTAAGIIDRTRAEMVAKQADITLQMIEARESQLAEPDREAVAEQRARLNQLVHIASNQPF